MSYINTIDYASWHKSDDINQMIEVVKLNLRRKQLCLWYVLVGLCIMGLGMTDWTSLLETPAQRAEDAANQAMLAQVSYTRFTVACPAASMSASDYGRWTAYTQAHHWGVTPNYGKGCVDP